VTKLIDNQEFLCFIQIYMNSSLDNLSSVVEIYQAFGFDECVVIMKERNDKIDSEMFFEIENDYQDFEIIDDE